MKLLSIITISAAAFVVSAQTTEDVITPLEAVRKENLHMIT